MITDKLVTLADAVALNPGAAGNYTIGDVIDLGVLNNQLNDPDKLFLVITMDVTATSGGSATLAMALITDDNASMSSPAVIWQGNAIAVASLVAGYRYAVIQLPRAAVFERYLGLRQVTGVAAFTAGAVNAFLTHDAPANTWRAYSDGIPSAA